jgi:serpin B
MSQFHQGALLLVVVSSALVGIAGQELPGQALPSLISGNERFGRHLLERVHRSTPEHNVVVSPISLSIVFGALRSAADDGDTRREIANAFGWGEYTSLLVPSRMLLAAFEKPGAPPVQRRPLGPPPPPAELPEAAWISNTVLYRGVDTLSERFIATGEKYFGMTFASTSANPTPDDIRQSRGSATGTLPRISSRNDVLVSSGTHLRTAWTGNTFSLSEPFPGEFETVSGRTAVPMLRSEVSTYRYAKTQTFEAVVLPCNRAYLLAVLPAPGQDILSFERGLIASLDAVDAALKPQAGYVTLPPFHIRIEANLRPYLEEMGIRQVFKDLGTIMKVPGSRLTETNQHVDIQVNRGGIRADAETVGGAIYGGVMTASEPFSMTLNRPFVFLIRDSTTDTLLFLGAVVDPSLD